MRLLLSLLTLLLIKTSFAQVAISIDATKDVKPISPYIYGRNNSLPKESYAQSLTTAEWTRLRESGVRILREGGGNNSTKYNWRKRLSSHPDWYNNVYGNDWDASVKLLRDSLSSNIQGFYTLQLIGKAASTNSQNFNDWGYNRSQWWNGVNQNLAGGGQPKTSGGSKAQVEGNPNLYLENWPADSTVGILDYWFNNLNIPKERVLYWNMDNEPEIWHGTHDDIINSSLAAEEFMQRYFAVAKKARAKFPNIKLVGPVPANEWQWYNWMNRITGSDGKFYPWLEYFIKRCAEEQKASGVRLLDVVDIHFYPGESTTEQMVQLHRVFFDKNYVYPGANGVKNITGNWDNSQTKEYIFGRINDWLNLYFGQNHGIKLGLTETDISSNATPSVNAVWYASVLGEFMKNEVEIFTPWSWRAGMWETLHLYSRYNKTNSVQGISGDETFVSAYPSVNTTKDSLTVVLVNRSSSETKLANLDFNNFTIQSTNADVLMLKSLPTSETFNSHTQNALEKGTATIANNKISVSLPPLSITSIILKGKTTTTPIDEISEQSVSISPNPFNNSFKIELKHGGFEDISIFDVTGKLVFNKKINPNDTLIDINTTLPTGIYALQLRGSKNKVIKKIASF